MTNSPEYQKLVKEADEKIYKHQRNLFKTVRNSKNCMARERNDDEILYRDYAPIHITDEEFRTHSGKALKRKLP